MKRNDTALSLRQRRQGAPKPGIRRRVMQYLVAFVAFVIALLWLFQIVWLDDFYRWDKTRQIKAASDAVTQNLDNEQLDRLVEHLASQNDVCILLIDEYGRAVLSSDDIRFCLIHRMSSRNLAFWCDIAPEDGSVLTELFNVQPDTALPVAPHTFRGNVHVVEEDHRQSLLCARRVTLAGGSTGYLLLNSIITPLDTTVSTLRLQLILITCVVLLGAVGLAWFIARKVTRPIIETNEAARALSRGQYESPSNGGAYREMAELNATLSRAAGELSQVDRLQHELIANISHDLRTPLTMIGGYAEAMRDIPGEANPENMQIIIDETNRLTSLVSELLDFSRLQTDHAPMEIAPFALTDSVEAIVQRVAKLTEKDGYILRFEPQERIMALADEKRIGQVVYNLLGNALTYTGADRTVTVTQEIRDGGVRLSIRDSGKGIPPEELPLIWNRYYRAQESHKRAVIGSGLGLSIVQSILEKHGARYGVDSTEGEGTAFWFEVQRVEK
ncbi:MAG: HAMP domain-containing histidine kinase [Clostridia bacterium]|nr:HAMP domain-containing histidine kinase [Clostridia bacterium]